MFEEYHVFIFKCSPPTVKLMNPDMKALNPTVSIDFQRSERQVNQKVFCWKTMT